jgi:serine O-acetyltransferase
VVATTPDRRPVRRRWAVRAGILRSMLEDVENARLRDPAARTGAEVALTYAGVHAVWGYRLAHALWGRRAYLAARMLSQYVRFLTGVEIHPGATIGRRLFIDHGMGVVIGATAVVGDDVMLYHGVTLGGRSSSRHKRHPTLGDGVVVGAGAAVLGDISIGENTVIGAQAVVVRDAPAGSVLTGIPARSTPPRATEVTAEDFYTDPGIYI